MASYPLEVTSCVAEVIFISLSIYLVCMLFDKRPKSKRKDLFGEDYLLDSLLKQLNKKSGLIVIKGLRRTGKTSILKVALEESNMPYVLIDVRYAPYTDRRQFLDFLAKEIIKVLDKDIVSKIIKKISRVSLSLGNEYFKGSLDFDIKDDSDFLTVLREANKKNLILAFDEAQYLSGINFDMIIAGIYDNFPNIGVVLTGSEIGLLEDFLGKGNDKAPLYGRLYFELKPERFDPERTFAFLEAGFKQYNQKISKEEINQVIEEFDGVVGWHTYYGYLRCDENKNHLNALKIVAEIGSRTAYEEFERFLNTKKSRERYQKLMKLIMLGKSNWSQIKKEMLLRFGKISDSQLSKYLKDLLYHGFVEKSNEKYLITDPLLIKGIEQNIKF